MSVLALLMAGALFAYPPLPQPRNEDEHLLIRRIIDFWRDKDYAFAQTQIKSYLKGNPDSPYRDHFLAMLGDMALQCKNFEGALDFYGMISNGELQKYTDLKRWQALYHLRRYSELYQEISPIAAYLNEEGLFYLAEAAFREALTLFSLPEGKKVAESLCQEALPLYENLLEKGAYLAHAKMAMAEIYRLLGHPEQSAALYLELADENNPEVLFHAARVLLQCDKLKAKEIFQKLAKEDFTKSQAAAYHWLLLLAEDKEWDQIEKERDFFTLRLEKEHLPLYFFYSGIYNFEKNEYSKAYYDLLKCCEGNLPAPYEQKALLTLLTAAGNEEKWEAAESCFETLAQSFPELTAQAGWMLASAYQRKEQSFRALKIYDRVLKDFPESPFAEKASSEKISLFLGQQKYLEAHHAITTHLAAFPMSPKRGELLRLAADLSAAQVQEKGCYEELAADLERGFQENAFGDEELLERETMLVKTYLKLERAQEARSVLSRMKSPEALLWAQCYIAEGGPQEKIVEYGEIALEGHPEEKSLHLSLFNAYVALGKENSDKAFKRQAAYHLDMASRFFPISLDNKVWLAHYFYKESPEKAISLLESILEADAGFEEEAILLASLYTERNQLEKAESLLMRASAGKEFAQTASLKLAEIYTRRGDSEKAGLLYQQLESSPLPAVAFAAELALARLNFQASPEKSLEKLRELSLKKAFATEPIHLEAALDFAEYKASMAPAEEYPQHHLSLLLEIKESFTKQDDITSKDYHAGRDLYPEKELIYQAYMRYLDARIYLLQAKLASDPVDGKTKLNAARALMSTLRHGKYAVSQYIKEKAALNYYDS